jgi:hypothetical protein
MQLSAHSYTQSHSAVRDSITHQEDLVHLQVKYEQTKSRYVFK